MAHNEWRAGRALVGALLHACLTADIEIQTGTRAVRLEKGEDRVIGAWVKREGSDDAETLIEARGGVILASGGFEWNSELVQAFLGTPMDSPVSAPTNVGDGLRMAMAVGGQLGNMSQAWWTPAIRVADEYYEGGPLNRFVTHERPKPGSIVANRTGRRFARETLNYNDFGKAMTVFDGAAYEYPNTPAFLVFDNQCRRSYPMVGVEPGDPTPSWMNESSSLQELADKLSIDIDSFSRQIAEYNEKAAAGEDPDYRRGETDYERYAGDPTWEKMGPFDDWAKAPTTV
ncbi:FAD-binding protein [Arthrobacter sp. CDRTa11]|uniref:FAD-binding protein n=1 Tax=Arthrobacter sp. CDRTa11 TaxID=2651199 RepID=UPI002265B141|nr:FAD-binding protein [Arthrobacter sp. CDRTa11]